MCLYLCYEYCRSGFCTITFLSFSQNDTTLLISIKILSLLIKIKITQKKTKKNPSHFQWGLRQLELAACNINLPVIPLSLSIFLLNYIFCIFASVFDGTLNQGSNWVDSEVTDSTLSHIAIPLSLLISFLVLSPNSLFLEYHYRRSPQAPLLRQW